MNCIVFGGNGFIGSHLVDKLLSEGHYVRVFDKNNELFREPNIKVDYNLGDFDDDMQVAKSLQGIDYVFHLISFTTPSTSNQNPSYDIQKNVLLSINLFNECLKQNIKKIIFVSSGGTVYGEPIILPVSEDHSTNPISSYGVTKLMIEKYLYLYHKCYGLNYSIIRPSNPYGERQNPNGTQGVVPIFLNKILNNNKIKIWGDGGIIRDYIYIEDLVNAINLIAFSHSQIKIFNVGSGKGTSLNHLINNINNITGLKINVEYDHQRNYDIPKIYLDITCIKKHLDWQPKIVAEEGLLRTWQFIKEINASKING